MLPKRIPSWFSPPPLDAPIRYPRQFPMKVVPSLIGEEGQVLNLLMHHGAGAVVRDYSGYGNHGVITGASWLDGSFGWAMRFAVGEDITIPHSASLTVTEISKSFWIRDMGSSLIAFRRIFQKTGSYEFMWDIFPTIRVWITSGGVRDSVASWNGAGVIDDGNWHKIDAMYESATKTGWLYVDDVFRSSITRGAFAGDIDASVNDLVIGQAVVDIALPRLYDRVLSQPERTRHFESTRAIFGV